MVKSSAELGGGSGGVCTSLITTTLASTCSHSQAQSVTASSITFPASFQPPTPLRLVSFAVADEASVLALKQATEEGTNSRSTGESCCSCSCSCSRRPTSPAGASAAKHTLNSGYIKLSVKEGKKERERERRKEAQGHRRGRY